MVKRDVFLAVALFASAAASASQPVILIADSIGSNIAEGQASQHFTSLVQNERDVLFRVIGSPGSSLGSTDKTGFNSQRTIDAIDLIRGTYGWYSKLIVQAGTNDFGRNVPVANTVESLRRILDKVRADGKQAFVLDPIYRDGENIPNSVNDSICPNGQNTLNCYRFYMSVVCSQEYSDICTFVPRSTSGMGSLSNNYDSAEVAQNKRLHPNVTGNRKMADWIKANVFPVSSALKK